MKKSNAMISQLRKDYFSTPVSSLISLVIIGVILFVTLNIFNWGVVESVVVPDLGMCRAADGACWGFVSEKWRLILFGRYPYDEHWRAGFGTFAVVAMLVISAIPYFWTKTGAKFLMGGWALTMVAFFVLMYGGVFGLTPVDTDAWGGLPLTVILTLIGMTASVPIGILLALGRRTEMSALRVLSTGYIELVRGVPLITVLFVATYIFPLVLPSGWNIDAFWRIVIGIVLLDRKSVV